MVSLSEENLSLFFWLFFFTGLSQQGQLYNPVHFATELPDNTPIAFVVGAFAVGAINPIDHPYVCFLPLLFFLF
jgi:hypothetical protein